MRALLVAFLSFLVLLSLASLGAGQRDATLCFMQALGVAPADPLTCHCTWRGVTCDEWNATQTSCPSTTSVHSIKLDSIAPTPPYTPKIDGDCLQNLTSLKTLELRNMSIHGGLSKIPTFLRTLSMPFNAIQNISAWYKVFFYESNYVDLGSIETLDLSHNILELEFGGDAEKILFEKLVNLKEINLSHNRLKGSLRRFGLPYFEEEMLSYLRVVDFSSNQLVGPLPPLRSFGKVRVLNVSHNQIDEPITRDHLSSTLRTLDASHNAIPGALPQDPSLWASMHIVDLSNNKLIGSIPSLLPASSLQSLKLASNTLSGALPPSLWQQPQLLVLDLTDNLISGRIDGHSSSPTWNSTALQWLSLARNQLNDTLPPQLGSLTNLTYLGLSENQIEGKIIPEVVQLMHMHRLSHLDAFANLLSGTVPRALFAVAPSADPRAKRIINLSRNELLDTQILETLLHGDALNVELHFSGNNNETTQIPDTPKWSRFACLNLHLTAMSLDGPVPSSFVRANLSYLNLAFNKLSGDFPAAQLKGQNPACQLKVLSLGNQQGIRDHLRLPLGEALHALARVAHLREVYLDHMNLTYDAPCSNNSAARFLQELEVLSLAYSTVNDNCPFDVELFGLPRIRSIDLQGTLFRLHINESIAFSPSLRVINVGGKRMSAVIPWHKLPPQLEYLAIEGPEDIAVDASISAEASRNVTLRSLHTVLLPRTRFGHTLRNLCPVLPAIQRFSIQDSVEVDFLPDCLVSWRGLVQFIVRNCGLGGDDLPDFSTMSNLTELDLSNNRISSSTWTVQRSLVRWYGPTPVSPPLKVLNLQNNLIRGAAANLLVARNWGDLDLSFNSLNGEIQPSADLRMSSFTTIRLENNENVTGALSEELLTIPSLSYVNVANTSATLSDFTQCTVEAWEPIVTHGEQKLRCKDLTLSCNRRVQIRGSWPNAKFCECLETTGFGSNLTTCLDCPTWHPASRCSGGMITSSRYDDSTERIRVCPVPFACESVSQVDVVGNNSDPHCALEYTGRLCSECRLSVPHHGKQVQVYRHGKKCEPCQDSDVWQPITLLCVAFVALLAFTFHSRFHHYDSQKGTKKILIFWLQIMAVLDSSIFSVDVQYEALRSQAHGAGEAFVEDSFKTDSIRRELSQLVKLSFSSVLCAFDHPETHGVPWKEPWMFEFWLRLGLPLGIITLLCVAIFSLAHVGGQHLFGTRRHLRRMTMGIAVYFLVQFGYAGMTLVSLQVMNCTNPDGYMNALPFVKCDLEPVKVLVGVAWVAFLLVGLGLPALVFWRVRRIRWQEASRPADEQFVKENLMAWGHLYCSYRDEAWWYESVLMLRRLVVTMIVSLTPYDNLPLLFSLLMLSMLAFISIHAHVQPFKRRQDNLLEDVSLNLLLVLTVIGTLVTVLPYRDFGDALLALFGVETIGSLLFVIVAAMKLLREISHSVDFRAMMAWAKGMLSRGERQQSSRKSKSGRSRLVPQGRRRGGKDREIPLLEDF